MTIGIGLTINEFKMALSGLSKTYKRQLLKKYQDYAEILESEQTRFN